MAGIVGLDSLEVFVDSIFTILVLESLILLKHLQSLNPQLPRVLTQIPKQRMRQLLPQLLIRIRLPLHMPQAVQIAGMDRRQGFVLDDKSG